MHIAKQLVWRLFVLGCFCSFFKFIYFDGTEHIDEQYKHGRISKDAKFHPLSPRKTMNVKRSIDQHTIKIQKYKKKHITVQNLVVQNSIFEFHFKIHSYIGGWLVSGHAALN